MHPTPILATFSNISGRPKDIKVGVKGSSLHGLIFVLDRRFRFVAGIFLLQFCIKPILK